MPSDVLQDMFVRQLESDENLYVNRGNFALVRSIIMLVLATTCVALRFWCRKIRCAKYAYDDWTLLAALVSLLAFQPRCAASIKTLRLLMKWACAIVFCLLCRRSQSC